MAIGRRTTSLSPLCTPRTWPRASFLLVQLNTSLYVGSSTAMMTMWLHRRSKFVDVSVVIVCLRRELWGDYLDLIEGK